jgi:uncharacterized membrane protein
MPFVPNYWHPDAILNRWLGHPRGSEEWIELDIRGVGVVVFLVFTVLIGWIAKGLVGRSLLRTGEDLVGRLPVVRSIYNAVKQISETIFTQNDVRFDKPCLVESLARARGRWPSSPPLPRARSATSSWPRATERRSSRSFRPITPNATTGYVLFVPRVRDHRARHVARGRGQARHLRGPRLSRRRRGGEDH